MANENYFDDFYGYGKTPVAYGAEREREQFVEERGTTMDILHDLWAGTGEAIGLLGSATDSETLKGVQDYIASSEFGKSDVSQFYGTQGRVGRVVDGIARSLPTSLAIGGTAAAGGLLAGPVGAGAGFTAAMGTLGKGTFEQAMEEVKTQRPDLGAEDQFKYASTVAISEVGTEGLGWLVPFGIGKALSKPASKALMGSLLDSGRITTQEAIGSIVKNAGGREVVKGLFGGAVADGSSEVVNELIQASARDTAGLEEHPVDLIDIFLIGSAPGGAIAAGTMAFDSKAQMDKRASLETALKSDSIQERVNAVDTIQGGLDKIDPEIGAAFRASVFDKAVQGPVDLQVATELPKQESPEAVAEEIISNPEAIMEEEGISTGDPIAEAQEIDRAELEVMPEVYEEIRILDEGIYEPDVIDAQVNNYMSTNRPDAPLEGTAEYDAFITENDRITTALRLDDARSKGIAAGMKQVLIDSNKLLEVVDLNEREVIQKRIERTQKQISKEVAKVEPKEKPKEEKPKEKKKKVTVKPKDKVTDKPKEKPTPVEEPAPKTYSEVTSAKTTISDADKELKHFSLQEGSPHVSPELRKKYRKAYKEKASEVVLLVSNIEEQKKNTRRLIEDLKLEEDYQKRGKILDEINNRSSIISDEAFKLTQLRKAGVKAERPLVAERVIPVKQVEGKTYEEQRIITEAYEDDLGIAQAKAKRGTPEEATEAKERISGIAEAARKARRKLQGMPKPKEAIVYKNIADKARAKKKILEAKAEQEALADEPLMTPEVLEKIQAIEGESTLAIRDLAREHEGTTKDFIKVVAAHRKEVVEEATAKAKEDAKLKVEKAEGIGKGRTITYNDGTTMVYDPKAKASKRWLITQGAITKRAASEGVAKEAIESGRLADLKDYADVGKIKKTMKDIVSLSTEQKKAMKQFVKTQDPDANQMLAAQSLASQNKLYVDGKLDKVALDKETSSWKSAEEASSTEAKAASRKGIKSGATAEIELSTETDIIMPAEVKAPKVKEAAPEVKTVSVGEALKAEYLAKHKTRMKIQEGLTQEDYLSKKVPVSLEAAADKLLKGDVVTESMTDVLKDDVEVLRDEALYAEPDVLSWRKNREMEMTDEEVDAVYDYIVDFDNAYEAFVAFDEKHPGVPATRELQDFKMSLRSEIFHDGPSQQAYFVDKYKTAEEMLDGVIENGSAQEKALASFIKKSPKIGKLKGIPIMASRHSYYTTAEAGQIHMSTTGMLNVSTWLHEIQHAVTSQEIMSNKEIREEVQTMMRNLEKNSGLSESQLDAVAFAKGDSTVFNRVADEYGSWTDDQLEIAYALVNEREFLSQAYSSKAVRDLMRATRYTGGTQKTSIWAKIKELFSAIMQLPKEYDSVLEAALRASEQLYKIDPNTGIALIDNALDTTKERRKETLDEATRRVLKESPKETKRALVTAKTQDLGKSALTTFKKLAEPISDTLKRHSPAIHAKLMGMEGRQMLKGTEYSKGITPFLNYYKGLTESQKVRLNIGLLNSNKEVWAEMPANVRVALKKVLNDGADRSIAVGYLTEKKENYFPRRVKDINGLADYLTKDQDEKGPLGIALGKKAHELGMKVSELPTSIRNQVVTDMLASGEILQLPKPGSAKARSIGKVTSDLVPFYENANDSLMAHIYELNDKVSLKEFVGGSTRKVKVKALMQLNTKIDKETDKKIRDALMQEWGGKARELQDLEGELDQGLQAIIDKELSTADPAIQTEVLSLLSARMRQKGASGIGDTLRNVGYAATLGNFLSAITQFGDIPIIFYRYGVNKESLSAIGSAFKNVAKIATREITGKGDPTDAFVESMDFTNALREFSGGSNWSSKGLDTVLKYSGLKYSDLVGKEAAMQASLKFYQKPKNKQKFLDKYEHFFPNPEAVLQKIQMGNKKDPDVLTALFAELSDFQPVSLSQQSEVYLKSGNARMFYALKSFTLRTTSAAISEGIADFRKGGKKNIAKGAMKFASIIAIYSFAGAGADELKDLLRGRTSSLKDNTLDNVAQMFFLSTYDIKQGMQKDALLKGLMSQIIPPVRHFDNLIADVTGLVSEDKEFKGKSLSFVPGLGSILQARSEPQQASYAAQERTDIMEDIKKNAKKRRGARYGDITDRIRKYNRSVSRDLRISDTNVMRSYRS